MITGANNLQKLEQLLPKATYINISKSSSFTKRLWKFKFLNLSEQQDFLLLLSEVLLLDFIPIDVFPIYQLAVWHRELKDQAMDRSIKSELTYFFKSLNPVNTNIAYWNTSVKLLRKLATEDVIFIMDKTKSVIKLSGLYMSDLAQLNCLKDLLKSNYHYRDKKLVIACFKIIQITKNLENLGAIFKRFISSVLPSLRCKIKSPEQIEQNLLIKWLKLYVAHQQANIFKNQEDKWGEELSDLSFEIIIRNSPAILWSRLHVLSVQEQRLFIHLALGKNMRRLEPFQNMTKAMVHEFVNMEQSPFYNQTTNRHWEFDEYNYRYALSFFASNDFTEENIRLLHTIFNLPTGDFSFNMMPQLKDYKIIIDKLNEWFTGEEEEEEVSDYDILAYIKHCQDENIDFDIAKRTYKSMVRIFMNWRKEQLLAAEKYRSWKGTAHEPWLSKDDKQTFKIVQLTDSNQLIEEAIQLHHCVSTYAKACKKGKCAIWSLEETDEKGTTKMVTIELNKKQKIVQLKAKYNARPSSKNLSIIQKWAKREGIKIKKRALGRGRF